MMKRGLAALMLCGLLSGVAHAVRPVVMADPPPVTKDQVNRWMADLSNWGRWGKTDQIGTLNLITADKRKQALKLARDGSRTRSTKSSSRTTRGRSRSR
jgi:hypothetical protein